MEKRRYGANDFGISTCNFYSYNHFTEYLSLDLFTMISEMKIILSLFTNIYAHSMAIDSLPYHVQPFSKKIRNTNDLTIGHQKKSTIKTQKPFSQNLHLTVSLPKRQHLSASDSVDSDQLYIDYHTRTKSNMCTLRYHWHRCNMVRYVAGSTCASFGPAQRTGEEKKTVPCSVTGCIFAERQTR